MNTEDLAYGRFYKVDGRHFTLGIWNGTAFVGPRKISGVWELVEEQPWENGPPYGTAKPIEVIGDGTLYLPEPYGHNVLVMLRLCNILNEK